MASGGASDVPSDDVAWCDSSGDDDAPGPVLLAVLKFIAPLLGWTAPPLSELTQNRGRTRARCTRPRRTRWSGCRRASLRESRTMKSSCASWKFVSTSWNCTQRRTGDSCRAWRVERYAFECLRDTTCMANEITYVPAPTGQSQLRGSLNRHSAGGGHQEARVAHAKSCVDRGTSAQNSRQTHLLSCTPWAGRRR